MNYCFAHFFLACGFMFSLGSIIVFKRGKDDGAHMESQHSEAEAEGSLRA